MIEPERLELRVELGTPVLVCSDLHLGVVATEASRRATEEIGARIRTWTAPGVVVLNGDCFELLAPPGAQVAAVLEAHREFAGTLRHVVDAGGRVVVLIGSHDAAIGSDPDAANAVESRLGAQRALALDLVIETRRGDRVVRVEHGDRFDPASAPSLADQGYLRDARWLADPRDFGRFLGSRLVYRQVIHRAWWLAIPLLLGLVARTPVLVEAVSDHRHVQLVSRWLLVAGAGVVVDLALVLVVVAIAVPRIYRSIAASQNTTRPASRNEAAHAAAEALCAEGFAGFVTGHTHHPEIAPVPGGFYANTGCGTEAVEARPARWRLPPVFAGVLRRSWLELEGTHDVVGRLCVAESPAAPPPRLERLLMRRAAARPSTPTVVAEVPSGSGWPVVDRTLAATPRRRRARRLAAYGTLGVGIIGLASALTPPLRGRLHWLLRNMPVELPQAASTGLVFASIALLLLARGLRRGLRLAWAATISLLAISVVLNIVKGGDVEEAALTFALLAWLVAHHRAFEVQPDAAILRRSIVLAAGGAALAIGASFALVELVGAHRRTRVRESLGALAERLAGNRAVPLPAASPFIGPALTASGIGLVLGVLWVLFSPRRTPPSTGPAHVADRERARRIVTAHGGDTLAYFALRDDKAWFFSGHSVVAYAARNGVCLVSPDPIGPVDERTAVWADFTAFADLHGWSVAVVGAQPGWLAVYEAAGMRPIYMGDEAIVDCPSFRLEGNVMKGLRHAHSRVIRAGYTVEITDPTTLGPDAQAELSELMAETRQGDAERGFSMTLSRLFDPQDTGLLIAIARDADGRAAAFCQYVPAADIDGWSLDVMRRRADPTLPNGVTDVVVIETIKHIRANHQWGLALNFAFMRAVVAGEREGGFWELQRRVLAKFSDTMQIESLWRYNKKFQPYWRPRYVVVSAVEHAAAQGIAIADAESVMELPVLGRFLGRR